MLSFDERNLPEWFIVNQFNVDSLPNLASSTSVIHGRIGEHFHQQQVGARTIEVQYTIVSDDLNDLRTKTSELFKLLYSREPQVLEYSAEPDRYYNAILEGVPTQDETLGIGQGSLTFLVPDGMAHSKRGSNYELGGAIFNDGIFETPPRVILEVDEPTPSLTVVANDGVLVLGNSEMGSGSGDKPEPFNPKPTVFHDAMDSISGWATGMNYEGIQQGQIKTNGWSIQVDDLGERGEDKGWHGIVRAKSFPETQDFLMRARVGNYKTKIEQLGRIQIYMQDSNGVNQAMIELRNADPNMRKPMIRAVVGGKTVKETFGSYKGVWKDWQDGEIWIERKGTRFYFFGGMRKADGTMHTRWSFVYNDVKKEFQRKVSRIQFSMMGIREAPLPQLMAISDLRVEEHAKKPTNTPVNEIAFNSGDVVVVDSETGEVSLNGSPAYYLLDPSSDFPMIQSGANQMVVIESGVRGSVWFSERY